MFLSEACLQNNKEVILNNPGKINVCLEKIKCEKGAFFIENETFDLSETLREKLSKNCTYVDFRKSSFAKKINEESFIVECPKQILEYNGNLEEFSNFVKSKIL